MVKASNPATGVVVGVPSGGIGQNRAPDSRVREGAA
jgi:hypothetical protein